MRSCKDLLVYIESNSQISMERPVFAPIHGQIFEYKNQFINVRSLGKIDSMGRSIEYLILLFILQTFTFCPLYEFFSLQMTNSRWNELKSLISYSTCPE